MQGNLHVRFWSRSGESDLLTYGDQNDTDRPSQTKIKNSIG